MIRSLILLVTTLLLSTAAMSQSEAPSLDLSRTAVISGVISGKNLDAVSSGLEAMAKINKKPVSLIINSPGGSVVTGFWFINRMTALQAQGIKFRCYVPDLAASMAFQILMHCDDRIVLERSFLLWHRVRVSVGGMFGEPMTAPQARVLARSMQTLDTLIFRELRKYMPEIPVRDLRYHFEQESLHTGIDLHAMAPNSVLAYPAVDGLYEALGNEKLPRTQDASIFGVLNTDNEIIYQTTRLLPGISN